MKQRINKIRFFLERGKGKKQLVTESITRVKKSIRVQKKELAEYEKALEIVKYVGLETQKQLQFHISSVVSLALNAVFDDNPYELTVDFVERRNKTECDLNFVRDGNSVKPYDSSGGGAIDVAAFGLRIASWAMQTPRSRNVILLDEPLRFLSKDRQTKASQIIKELSEKMKIQFIIVTHEMELAEYADKLFVVSNKKGVSYVKNKEE